MSDPEAAGSSLHHRDSSAGPTVTLSHDDIAQALEDARAAWVSSSDLEGPRKALLELLQRLRGGQ